jgi:hypothetical protein
LKTIFSASRIGAPKIGAFSGAQIWRSALEEQDSTHSDFRKAVAQGSCEWTGFVRLYPRGPRASAAVGGAAMAPARISDGGPYALVSYGNHENRHFFARNAPIPDGF